VGTLRGSLGCDSPRKSVSKGARFWGFPSSKVRGVLGGISPAGTGLTGGAHRSDRCWSVDSRFGVPMRSRVGRLCVGS
jgi:hypothetical protein